MSHRDEWERKIPHTRKWSPPPPPPVENIIEPQVPHAPSFNTSMQDILGGIFGAAPQFAQAQFDEFSQFAPQTLKTIRKLAGKELPKLQAIQQGLITSGRGGELSDIERFTPQLNDIMRLSQGQGVTDARDLLQQQIFGDLSLGRNLGSEELRDVQQFQRSGEVSRGLGSGGGSANREAVARALSGRNLQQSRQRNAQGLIQLEKSLTPDPFGTISNLSNASTSGANSMFSSALAATPSGFPNAFNAASHAAGQQQLRLDELQGQAQLDFERSESLKD